MIGQQQRHNNNHHFQGTATTVPWTLLKTTVTVITDWRIILHGTSKNEEHEINDDHDSEFLKKRINGSKIPYGISKYHIDGMK